MLDGNGRSSKYFARLYLRTAFSAKRSNIPQIFWIYVLRRKECGKCKIWNTVENLNS
jgi:hypothetical protein